jgi:t-SNARE complex subunit (syntaxin)
VEEQRDRELVR